MSAGGKVVGVSGLSGLRAYSDHHLAMGTAKAASHHAMRYLAWELARRQITVNAIAPLAATPMTQNIRDNEKLAAMTLARIPLGRWAGPEEIAGSFVFMASDAAAYITGQVLPVDGGTVM